MRATNRSVLSWTLGFGLVGAAPGFIAVVPGCGTSPASTTWSPGGGGSNASNDGSGGTTVLDATTSPGAAIDSAGTPPSGGNNDSGSPLADSGGVLADSSPADSGSTVTDAAGSSGCGAATWPTPTGSPPSGSLPIQKYTISVSGTMRDYIVGLPTNYSSSQKYPVVFGWHGLGGTASQVANGGTSSYDIFGGYYGLRYQSNQSNKPMIFVAGQGLNGANDAGAGWPNTGGQDVAFTQAMVGWLEQNYCVDLGRIYSVGMSYGGIMSNTLGCAMGDVFRAITPMSGSGPGGYGPSPTCKGQVAAWLAHGTQDTTVPFASGQASRDFWAKANHCTATTMPTTPTQCVAYQGCDPGYPVDWCTFDGGHTVVSFEPQGIWAFLQQF